ncbi:Holliday junction DNA helicase RuvB C-terminal domain-containing protein, partial [Planctomycetota bacterium]
FWSQEHLQQCLQRSARLLRIECDDKAMEHLSRCSRGTPRIANRLLRRVRDYAQVHGDGKVTAELAGAALKMEEIDESGLDQLDRAFLKILITTYNGGPAGIEALAATLGEERDTLEDVVEPYLLQIGFVARTRSGRVATDAAYKHLNIKLSTKSAHDKVSPDKEGATLF